MKKYGLLLFSSILFITASGQSTFKAGVIGGLVTSQVHGDNYSGFDKAGITAGGFVKRVISESWDAKFEIIYVEKGSRHNARPHKGDYISYLLRLKYIEVPLVVRYKFRKWVPELGASPGFLVSAQERDNYGLFSYSQPFNRVEANLITGLAYQFKDNIEFNIRYTNSLTPARTYDGYLYYRNWLLNIFNRGMYNNVLTFTLHYQFSGKNGEQ